MLRFKNGLLSKYLKTSHWLAFLVKDRGFSPVLSKVGLAIAIQSADLVKSRLKLWWAFCQFFRGALHRL